MLSAGYGLYNQKWASLKPFMPYSTASSSRWSNTNQLFALSLFKVVASTGLARSSENINRILCIGCFQNWSRDFPEWKGFPIQEIITEAKFVVLI